MPLNIDLQQILLHLFNLSILVGGLYFLLYNPVKKFMNRRAEQYRTVDAETEERLAHAKELEAQWQEQCDRSEQELQEKRNRADRELAEYRSAELASAKEAAQKIVAQAQKNAEAEKAKILESANGEILSLTKAAAAKILHKNTSDAYDSFLDLAERSDDHVDDPS
ncbi:MAG: ATP synthase F0 subunit B [Clostridia bacterium]|nr:ATP synthase F0 subunit B [Clostridia bacterium]